MAKMVPKDPNAFATLYKGSPLVCVNRALLNSIVEGNANRLAFILGHELSHVTLGLHGQNQAMFCRFHISRLNRCFLVCVVGCGTESDSLSKV